MTTENKVPNDAYPVLLEKQREWMSATMPELLAGLEPLITEYKLNDHDAHDLLFDAQCGHDSEVPDKNTIEGMAYDLKHGLRPEPHSPPTVKMPAYSPGALIPYVLTKDPAKLADHQKTFGISQDAAVDVLIEETDWGGQDLPHLRGNKGTAPERLREMRRVLREAGQTE
jgi:hypothetical protein